MATAGDPAPAGRVAPSPPLRVGGFVPFTTTDYPDALAAVVFCQGCPWRCALLPQPAPHRAAGRRRRTTSPPSSDWLATRRGLLDAVVFSGGEPTAQAALPDAVALVRDLGFAVGLHTGGAYPRRLAALLPQLDWVGLDVKAAESDYPLVTGIDGQRDVRAREPRPRAQRRAPRTKCARPCISR